jgi:hypothetical protein
MSDSKYKRRAPFKQAREEVLVVCGGRTEELYFKAFNRAFHPSLGRVSIVTVMEAKNPLKIVEYAVRERQRNNTYNAVWCVFDKDDFPDFDDAIYFARRNDIGTAFSNQAFELWFINHFKILNSPMHRSKYKSVLTGLLNFTYDKGESTVNKVCKTLLVENYVKTAINNTRLGYERHIVNNPSSKPSAFESCTTVFMLIKSLLEWK